MELQDLYSSHGQFIGGAWRPGTESVSAMVNPATEAVLGDVTPAGAAQVAEAIDAAFSARGAMRALTAWNRSALLRRAAALIGERAETLGRLVALETGKPVRQAVGEAEWRRRLNAPQDRTALIRARHQQLGAADIQPNIHRHCALHG